MIISSFSILKGVRTSISFSFLCCHFHSFVVKFKGCLKTRPHTNCVNLFDFTPSAGFYLHARVSVLLESSHVLIFFFLFVHLFCSDATYFFHIQLSKVVSSSFLPSIPSILFLFFFFLTESHYVALTVLDLTV